MPAVQLVNVPDHRCVSWCCPTNKGWRMQIKLSKTWSLKTSTNSLQFWQLYNLTGKFWLRIVVSVFTFQSIPSKSPLPCRYGANRPGRGKGPPNLNGGVPGGYQLHFCYPNFIRESQKQKVHFDKTCAWFTILRGCLKKEPENKPLFFPLFGWILNCWCLKKIDFYRETCVSKKNN